MEESVGYIKYRTLKGFCRIIPLDNKYKKLYYLLTKDDKQRYFTEDSLVIAEVEKIDNDHENVDTSLLYKVVKLVSFKQFYEENSSDEKKIEDLLDKLTIDQWINALSHKEIRYENSSIAEVLKNKAMKMYEEAIFSSGNHANDERINTFRKLNQKLFKKDEFDFSSRILTSGSERFCDAMWQRATNEAKYKALMEGNFENKQGIYNKRFLSFINSYNVEEENIIVAARKIPDQDFFSNKIYYNENLPIFAKYERFEKFFRLKLKDEKKYQDLVNCYKIKFSEPMIIYFIYWAVQNKKDIVSSLPKILDTDENKKYKRLRLVLDVLEKKPFNDFRSDLIDLLNVFNDYEKLSDTEMREYLKPLFFPCNSYKNIEERGMDKLFCEAQYRKKKEEFWCEANGYSASSCIKYMLSRSHWKLYNLCKALDYKIEYSNKELECKQYVPRAAGHFNQLNRVREHLGCRNCNGKLMNFKFEYNKNGSIYIKTVAKCDDCGEIVYLNRCWHCGSIIDSRDSKFQDNGYYICINCGAGDKGTFPYHRPTGTCPKCGKPGVPSMYIDYSGDEKDREAREGIFKCKYCGHEIKKHRTDNTPSYISCNSFTQDNEDGEIPF